MKARELVACYVLGTFFGVVLVQGEIVSWFRIHEMFRFEAFHMYGVIGSALAVSATSLWIIRRFAVRTLSGDRIVVPPTRWSESTDRRLPCPPARIIAKTLIMAIPLESAVRCRASPVYAREVCG